MMLSPIETTPSEILDVIYAKLERSPWKLPLGMCSKTLYKIFKSHIELQKENMLNKEIFLSQAARLGDPILTQIRFNPGHFSIECFVKLCLYGNVDLAKYIDAYLFLADNDLTDRGDQRALSRLGHRHKLALKKLLRNRTIKKNGNLISLETLNKFLFYFIEEISQNFKNPDTSKEQHFVALAGFMGIHGAETYLYYDFEKCMVRLASSSNISSKMETVSRSILLEYFYVGKENLPKGGEKHSSWIWRVVGSRLEYLISNSHRGAYCRLLLPCVNEALCSPYKNEEAIREAWDLYVRATIKYGESITANQLECFFSVAAVSDKVEIFTDITKDYITEREIPIDYHRVWLICQCAFSKHFHMWKLDPKKCLMPLLDENRCYETMIATRVRPTFKRLLKCCPDVLHLLTPEEIAAYAYLGLYCPKCLGVNINRGRSYQCKNCLHIFSSDKRLYIDESYSI